MPEPISPQLKSFLVGVIHQLKVGKAHEARIALEDYIGIPKEQQGLPMVQDKPAAKKAVKPDA